MKNFSSFFIIILLTTGLKAQDHQLKLIVPGFGGNRVYLSSVQGDENTLIDSMLVTGGEIHFDLTEEYHPGMYRVYLSHPSASMRREPVFIDFIFNHEDVELLADLRSQKDIIVLKSEENRMYYDFMRYNSAYRDKLRLLIQLTDSYIESDPFFAPLRDELVRVQKAYNDSIVQMTHTSPNLLASSLISLQKEPVYDPAKYPDLELFMQENYLKPVSFNDERLIHTPAITKKIISYLSFFRSRDANQRSQEQAFIKAVDRIMAEVSYNQDVYDFVLDYLIDGFEQFKMEEVLVHIADNHLTGECKTESEEIMQERLAAYKRMAPGNRVPDINLLDPFDENHRLSSLENDNILVVFWSSECPHCTSLLPRLAKWYEKEKENYDLEVYAVSIDKSRADWEEFVLLNDLTWINVYDPKGWESKTSRLYNLYATPTMFLLNSDREILAKPVTFREVKKAVEGHVATGREE